MADAQWLAIRNPLRLQYAVDRDFGPLDTNEILVRPVDKTFGARLQFGSAMSSGSLRLPAVNVVWPRAFGSTRPGSDVTIRHPSLPVCLEVACAGHDPDQR